VTKSRIKQSLFVCFASLTAALTAQEAFMVVEAHSGKVLMAQNSTVRRPVASLTKISTGVIATDWAIATSQDLKKVIATVPESVTRIGGPNPMNLQPGQQISLSDALYAALLGSDNYAAMTIADHIGRDMNNRRGRNEDPVWSFVKEMNELARVLGMKQTRFLNPHGLELPKQEGYSTAADLAKLSIYAMRRPAFAFFVRQKSRNITVAGRTYSVNNTNQLVGESGILGIKTGQTAAAGPCLATSMDKDPIVRTKPDGTKGVTPRRVIVVLLNSSDRFGRTRGLLSAGWSAYDQWLATGGIIQDPKREVLVVPKF
jgi:serine-type D-Ala-D-Ala carboxypeptidase (penicillin-binding protein 5/6)